MTLGGSEFTLLYLSYCPQTWMDMHVIVISRFNRNSSPFGKKNINVQSKQIPYEDKDTLHICLSFFLSFLKKHHTKSEAVCVGHMFSKLQDKLNFEIILEHISCPFLLQLIHTYSLSINSIAKSRNSSRYDRISAICNTCRPLRGKQPIALF